MSGHDQSILDMLISPSIIMLGNGEGKAIMLDLAIRIMSLNSMAGQEGGRYIMLIISEGWWLFIISRSHLTIENSGIWISLLLISSHRHINNVDKLHKSYNTLHFDFVFVMRLVILR